MGDDPVLGLRGFPGAGSGEALASGQGAADGASAALSLQLQHPVGGDQPTPADDFNLQPYIPYDGHTAGLHLSPRLARASAGFRRARWRSLARGNRRCFGAGARLGRGPRAGEVPRRSLPRVVELRGAGLAGALRRARGLSGWSTRGAGWRGGGRWAVAVPVFAGRGPTGHFGCCGRCSGRAAFAPPPVARLRLCC